MAALVVFVVVENRVRWPLVDLSLARNPRFTILVIAGTIANIAYGVTISCRRSICSRCVG